MKYILWIILPFLYLECSSDETISSDSTIEQIPSPIILASTDTEFISDTIDVCSFNIQFLGSFKKRNDSALADILKNYDIVIIQELVAAPYAGEYPDNTSYDLDIEANKFFEAMLAQGFLYKLSEEDTGTKDKIHSKGTSTEWWVIFYKEEKVKIAEDLPNGFLADDRSNHPNYERVPYAFPFRTIDNNLDFVLISVHLQPGDKEEEKERRIEELHTISKWINANNELEKDIIILGDMNIYDTTELSTVTPEGYLSLNDECRKTNTLINTNLDKGARPYDHIMYNVDATSGEIDLKYDFQVIDLISIMKPFWKKTEPYPGAPYNHNLFKQYYSDHHPVTFKMVTKEVDDD